MILKTSQLSKITSNNLSISAKLKTYLSKRFLSLRAVFPPYFSRSARVVNWTLSPFSFRLFLILNIFGWFSCVSSSSCFFSLRRAFSLLKTLVWAWIWRYEVFRLQNQWRWSSDLFSFLDPFSLYFFIWRRVLWSLKSNLLFN